MNIEKLEFEFDLNGFCIVPNFLSKDLTEEMNRVIRDERLTDSHGKFHFIESHDLFFELIFHPDILALCSRWIDPHFRFDHCWGVHYPPSQPHAQENLHAGPYQNHGFFQYHWYNNRPKASCIIFAYALEDQPRTAGGLVLIPGSHKLNVPIIKHPSTELFARHYGKDFSSVPTLFRPDLKRGDLLIMAEATIHGTSQWVSSTAWRRNLYYKYCYGFMSWLPHSDPVNERLRQRASSELQRRVLEAPYVSKISGNVQQWRDNTIAEPRATVSASHQGTKPAASA